MILSLVLMVMDHRYHHLESVRAVLSLLTYPLQYAASMPVRTAGWISEAFITRRQLKEDNKRLHLQNLVLKARLQKFQALETENMRLRDLLDSSFKIGDRVLIAELMSVALDPYHHQVIIDKGSNSGVFVGQAVVDANAVMGQVTRVTPFTATVLLITDATHALPVQVARNSLRTIAVGTGLVNRLELPHLPNNADIRKGDLLVTSGLGGVFPAGYPVAKVTEVRHEPGRPFATVLATPTAHLERSHEVLLIWTLKPKLAAGVSMEGADAQHSASGNEPTTTDTPPEERKE